MMKSSFRAVSAGAVLLLIALVLMLSGLAGLRPEPRSAEAALFNEIKKLTGSGIQNGDDFGYSVGLSGDTAIVGPFSHQGGVGQDIDAVYIFQQDLGGADNWGEVKKLTGSDSTAGDGIGNSVAVSGDTAVAGSYLEDSSGTDAGAAYVFERNQGGTNNWGQVKKLVASDAAAGDHFSYRSVAVSGDVIVVGAHNENGADGAAYVFHRNQGGANNWGQVKKLTTTAGGRFGRNVALSGDRLIAGANGAGVGGAAYIFERNQGGTDNWGLVRQLVASDVQSADFGGFAVGIDGDIAVMGAFGEDGSNPWDSLVGAAYVFERNQGGTNNWGQVKKLIGSDAVPADNVGYSTAVSGDSVLVGTRYGEAAYVFDRDEGGANNWGEVRKLTASGAEGQLGESVALSGNIAILGARNAEAAYVFDLLQTKATPTPCDGPCPTPTLTPTLTPTPTTTPTPTPCGPAGCATPTPTPSCPAGNDGFEQGTVGSTNIPCWTVASNLFVLPFQSGGWCTQSGTEAPEGDCAGLGLVTLTVASPPQGLQAGMTNQGAPGTLVLYRCQVLASSQIEFQLYLRNTHDAYVTVPILDYWSSQQFRADLVTKSGMETDPYTTGSADILMNLYQTQPGDPLESGYGLVTGNASEFVGQEVCLRFATSIFYNILYIGIDDVLFSNPLVPTSTPTPCPPEGCPTSTPTQTPTNTPSPTPTPDLTDTDGDGCTDQRENGPDEMLGGMRDYLNPSDYYDVAGGGGGPPDQIIDLSNDIFGVIIHYAPTGTEPEYDVNFDRGPSAGPNPWNMTAPDGVIDLTNDIFGVIQQYFHSCQ